MSSLFPALIGVVLGSGIGLAAIATQSQPTPKAPFVVAAAITIVLTTVGGSLPGAVFAAWRDPARVLRVP